MRLTSILAVFLTLALAVPAFGQREKLKVGDQAPGLDIDTWVKGDAVSVSKGKVYVVEFWATWCVPCKKSIPHLTELQKKYGSEKLVIVGVSDESVDLVKPFVQKQGDRMNYAVGTDRRSGTSRAWMKAAGLNTIPAAFIVDRAGKIAFIGSPLDPAFDDVLAGVMAGRYDPVLQARAEPILRSARRARTVRNWRLAHRHYDEVIALDDRVFAEVAIEKFKMVLLDMKDIEAAYEYARTGLIKERFADDAGALEMLAAEIATDPGIERVSRDLDVAATAARAALELDGMRDPQALSTMALVHFHAGEIDEAIELQTRAYFLAQPQAKSDYKRVLASYREAASRAGTASSRS
jgi:thiol-disulfide isomerase/thioredoxin